MTLNKSICAVLLSLSFFSTCALAQPNSVEPTAKQVKGKESISRSELVRDLDSVLSRWEMQSAQYATKKDLDELRSLLVQMQQELKGLSAELSDPELESLEQRVQNLRRPGF